jgi:hypothetical protein
VVARVDTLIVVRRTTMVFGDELFSLSAVRAILP